MTIRSLVDSGCSGRAFIDRRLVSLYNLPTTPLRTLRTLCLADGKPAGILQEYVLLPMKIGSDHAETGLFFVTDLSERTPVIVSLPWLQEHNPSIDWTEMTLRFSSAYCRRHCCLPGLPQPPAAPVLADLPGGGSPNALSLPIHPLRDPARTLCSV